MHDDANERFPGRPAEHIGDASQAARQGRERSARGQEDEGAADAEPRFSIQHSQATALEAQRQRVLAAERESADVGIVTLRTAILVNAGAVVALLAFVGQLWASQKAVLAAVLGHAYWFFWGSPRPSPRPLSPTVFVEMKSAREDRRYFAMLKGKDALTLGDPYSPAKPGDWLAVLVGALISQLLRIFCHWRLARAHCVGCLVVILGPRCGGRFEGSVTVAQSASTRHAA